MAFASHLVAELPSHPGLSAAEAVPAYTAVTLDAASEYCGGVFQAPKAGVIKKLHFALGTVTTGTTLEITIEGVSASTGGPDGAPLTNGSTTLVVTTEDASSVVTAEFSTGPAVTQGQLIAVKIANPASSAGNLQVNIHSTTLNDAQFPYSYTAVPSVTKSRNSLCITLEYGDGSFAYIPGVLQAVAFATDNLMSNGTPDEIGIKFTLAMPIKARGFWIHASCIAASSFTITLYDSDGSTVLEALTVDSEQVQATAVGAKRMIFTQDHELDAGSAYRLTLKNESTSPLQIGGLEVASAAAMAAWEGGSAIHRTERTDDGSWTDTTTKRPWMGLLISAFDDGVSEGGGGSGGSMNSFNGLVVSR